MEMEFTKTAIPCLKQILCRTAAQEQTQELRLGDGMPDAGRVLGCWGQLLARGKQWRDRRISLSAGCTIWVLYAPEDGSQAQMLEGYVPLQLEWELPETETSGDIRVDMEISGMDARIVSPRKLMVRLNVNAQARAFVPDYVSSFESREIPEDVQLLKKTYPVTLICEAGEKMVNPEERFSLPGAEKILCYHMMPVVTETKLSAGRLLIKGIGKVTLLCMGTDGKLFTESLELPFSQLADPQGEVGENADVDVTVCPTGLEVDLEDDAQLRVRADLVCQYLICQRQEVTLFEDCYSNLRDLNAVTGKVSIPAILDSVAQTVSLEIPWEYESGEVVNCSLWTRLTQSRAGDGGVACELRGTCQVLCYNREGKLDSKILPWEESMHFPSSEACDMVFALKRGELLKERHGSISADMELTGECMSQEEKTLITALELGEEKERDEGRPSVILRRAGTQELWDLAKACGSTVEGIRRANELEDEPVADMLLLIPVT